jgi:hypothetical protein
VDKFKPSSYYFKTTDATIVGNLFNKVVTPLPKGRELIAHYYKEKYESKVIFLEKEFSLNEHLKIFREKGEDCRVAFILQSKTYEHHIPMIYIRENGKEALLYADSKGSDSNLPLTIGTEAKIPVYIVKNARQADHYSCYTDALAISRDATAKNYATGKYRIPQLLSFLENNSVSNRYGEPYAIIESLPNMLLKTAQIKNFVESYSDKENLTEPVHKDKTLETFRKSYKEDVNIIVGLGYDDDDEKSKPIIEKKSISTYLKKKGIKFADVIEIQFYLNQLEKNLGTMWSDELRKKFIAEAKETFHSQPTVLEGRDGLHEMAEKFLLSLQQKEEMTVVNITPNA